MAGNLIIPRVEVYWGDVNLTSYNGKAKGNYPIGEPLVYKVECRLPGQSDNPDGSMMWAPTQGAYEVYEDLVNNHTDKQIVTSFGYLGTKKVSFVWMWSGQSYTYGNTMSLRVTFFSELSGLINATVRSVNNNQDTTMSMLSAIQKTEKLYEVDKLKIVKYTTKAAKDLQTNKINNQYGREQSFVSAINNIVQENGNYMFSTNIISEANTTTSPITGRSETASKLVIFTPFTYEGDSDTVLDGQSRGYNSYPDPTKRYGYLIGPSIINSMERTFKWAPPQQINMPTPAKFSQPRKKKEKAQTPVQTNVARVTTGKGSVISPALASPNPGISVAKDSVGPSKQIQKQEESVCQLQFSSFLVPALVGIKPYDIIYVPSLNAKELNDIEDWIVTSVDYNQTDGGVDISVSATRTYGKGGTLMNSASGKKFLDQAKQLTTLEKWEEYAWVITPTTTTATPSTSGVTSIPVIPFGG